MTKMSYRPLPVGGLPAWLTGPCPSNLQPLMYLTPSRLQYGADLTSQENVRSSRFSVAFQLRHLATPSQPNTSMISPTLATGICSTTRPSSFIRLPIGGQKGLSTPSVSASNRSKRDNCCRARGRLKIGYQVTKSKTQYYNWQCEEQPLSPKISRNTETITFSLPPEMAQRLRQVVKEEDRTVSELLREAIRL